MTLERNLNDGSSVPGLWRFGWLVFMQPRSLKHMFQAWGFRGDPSLRELLPRWKTGEPLARKLVLHAAMWLGVLTPILGGGIAILLKSVGVAINWEGVAFGVTFGVALGAALSVADGIAGSVAFGTVVGVAFGAAFGTTFGIAKGVAIGTMIFVVVGVALVAVGARNLTRGTLRGFVFRAVMLVVVVATIGVASGVAFGVAFGAAFSVAFDIVESVAIGIAGGVAFGVASGIAFGDSRVVAQGVVEGTTASVAVGVTFGVAFGVAFGVEVGIARGFAAGAEVGVAFGVAFVAAYIISFFRPILWFLESLMSFALALSIRIFPGRGERLTRWLPFLHDELIFFPLPGLTSFLVELARQEPQAVITVMNEALSSYAQRYSAERSLVELRADTLERAANDRLFARVAELELPFFPLIDTLPLESPLRLFSLAARDLSAGGSDHRHRRLALERAERTLQSILALSLPGRGIAREEYRRLLRTAQLWLDVAREDKRKLACEEEERPQVPAVFVAGPPLAPGDPDARSLFKGRNDLAEQVTYDLSPDRRGILLLVGHSQRHQPHHSVLETLAARLPAPRPPPNGSPWGDALGWLKQIDASLGERRVLVVIDEVERLEDGIRDGWCQKDFLDFLRACGDALARIRILLLTAYPLARLGPHWVDRLISVTPRNLSYLNERAARELICRPVPGFPDIYPEGGVECIMTETNGHPFLIQKICDELCRLLNQRGGRRQATRAELDEAIDQVLNNADLFDELWRQRTEAERELLRRLAGAPTLAAPDPVQRQLLREGYLENRDEQVCIAVPLFRIWIAENQGTL